MPSTPRGGWILSLFQLRNALEERAGGIEPVPPTPPGVKEDDDGEEAEEEEDGF